MAFHEVATDVEIIKAFPMSEAERDFLYRSSFRPTTIYLGLKDNQPDRNGTLEFSFDEQKFADAWKRYFNPPKIVIAQKSKFQLVLKNLLESWKLI